MTASFRGDGTGAKDARLLPEALVVSLSRRGTRRSGRCCLMPALLAREPAGHGQRGSTVRVEGIRRRGPGEARRLIAPAGRRRFRGRRWLGHLFALCGRNRGAGSGARAPRRGPRASDRLRLRSVELARSVQPHDLYNILRWRGEGGAENVLATMVASSRRFIGRAAVQGDDTDLDGTVEVPFGELWLRHCICVVCV